MKLLLRVLFAFLPLLAFGQVAVPPSQIKPINASSVVGNPTGGSAGGTSVPYTSAATPSTLVSRDSSGNAAVGVPAATLTGSTLASNVLVRYSVSDIAALQAISVTSLSLNSVVDVLGYYSAADGGGGLFYYDPSSSATNAQGGITPTVGTGRWIRIPGQVVTLRQFGAKIDGATDDSTAVNNAMTYANANGRRVVLEGGVIAIASTIVIPGRLQVDGSGFDSSTSSLPVSTFKALTIDMLMITYGSMSKLSSFVVNGDNKALWGIMSRTSTSHAEFNCVEVSRCTEYGFVLNSLQNSNFFNCTARYNKYGWVWANGTRNCVFTGCSAEVNSAVFSGTYADARCLLFLLDTTNPHSFGLSTSVTFDGNSNNNWNGGVLERCYITISEIVNTTYTGNKGLINWFRGVNLVGDSAILDTTNGSIGIEFNSCEFGTGGSSSPMGVSTAGGVRFRGSCNFNGGESFLNRGWTQNNNFKTLFYTYSSDLSAIPSFTSSSSDYSYGGATTVPITFTASTNTFSVTALGVGSQPYHGLAVSVGGPARSASATIGGLCARQSRPIISVSFTVSNIVGGSTQIKLYENGASAPFQISRGTFSAGTYTIIFQAATNSAGGVTFGLNDCTSYDISNIGITFL